MYVQYKNKNKAAASANKRNASVEGNLFFFWCSIFPWKLCIPVSCHINILAIPSYTLHTLHSTKKGENSVQSDTEPKFNYSAGRVNSTQFIYWVHYRHILIFEYNALMCHQLILEKLSANITKYVGNIHMKNEKNRYDSADDTAIFIFMNVKYMNGDV